jgi:tetratricopeptide (TPR) repeat protein
MDSPEEPFERDIQAALMRGQGRAWVGDERFSGPLVALRETAAAVAADGDHARAADLLAALVSGCLEKLPEVDDSLGRYARFVERLVEDWIRARQQSDADPAETAVGLAGWVVDDGGSLLDRFRMWGADTLDEDTLEALELTLRLWSEDLPPGSPAHRRASEILKAVLALLGDVEAYAALCKEATGLSPRDAEVLGETCRRMCHFEEALAWADRGIALETAGDESDRVAWDLPRLRRAVLHDLGRKPEALDERWKAFEAFPSVNSFEELMGLLTRSERGTWRKRALDSLRDAPIALAIEILLFTGEDERLARLIDDAAPEMLREVSQLLARPTAERLRAGHPLLAARLYEAVAWRLLGSGRNGYYRRILSDLREARDLLTAHGGDRDWARLVEAIRVRCRKKTVFLPRFERLAQAARE